MRILSIDRIRYENVDFEIADIFPESWTQRREFSLYKNRGRPCSALFFVCTEIEVSFFAVGESEVVAHRGDVVFIPQGSCYHVRVRGNAGGGIDSYTVNFRLFDKVGEDILFSNAIAVLTSRQDNLPDVHLKTLFDTFYRVESIDGVASRNFARIRGEFFLLLDLLAESASQCGDYYYPVRRGIEAFCREWNLNEKIEKYAQLSGVSETYFYRCFRRWSGSSPVEYRNLLRLSNAESMLRCTDMKIGEISETVGFEDPFYFCRIFAKKYGTSPQKYRKWICGQGE